eukprot:14965407-Ditylum_brightwellii.AAC.1
MNKDNRNCYLIPLLCWMKRFIPHLHMTPQILIVKPEKNDRLVLDGSIKLNWNSRPVNPMTHPLFVPCGNTFGSNTSTTNWEPIRKAREALAQ